MESKNRFGLLLASLMNAVSMKNYILAQELQYDVSYISKWVSGKVVPAEKTEKQVLQGISHCIVSSANPRSLAQLMDRYQVPSAEELERAIYDHLVEECAHSRETMRDPSVLAESSVRFYPELSMDSCIQRMHHPVLRHGSNLDIVAMMDLISMKSNYRRNITSLRSDIFDYEDGSAESRLSMVFHVDPSHWNLIHDTIFLISAMTQLAGTDFSLYSTPAAISKTMLAIRDGFALSAMNASEDRCICVVTTEQKNEVNVLFYYIKEFCTRENLLFRRCSMAEMLRSSEYIQNLLAPNPRWLFGHMTEHFLPPDLFEELLEQYRQQIRENGLELSTLRIAHQTCLNVIRASKLRILFFEKAFFDLFITGNLNFFHINVVLTPEQRIRYLEHLLSFCQPSPNRQIRLIHGIFPEFQDAVCQTIMLSNHAPYLNLYSPHSRSNLMVFHHYNMHQIFSDFFETSWSGDAKTVTDDIDFIREFVQHTIQSIALLHKEA